MKTLRLSFVSSMSLVAAALFAPSAFAWGPGQRIIENGDFETGKVAGWVNWMPGGKARIDDTLSHSGKWCLRMRCYKCHGEKPTNAMVKSLQMPW